MLKLISASKIYGESGVRALDNISLTVRDGEYVSITGASGSGKSTLMHILGLLDTLTDGTYLLGGEDVSALPPKTLARLRGEKIGFVFQRFQLIPGMTALENAALPLTLQGVPRAERLRRAEQALASVGLSHRAAHRPGQLSGGQQQRVAIARAVITEPCVVLADEPTAGLDPEAASDVLDLLDGLHRKGNTVVLITHDRAAAARAARRLYLENGTLTG
ncbi:MAG: ABC transporter ATP-binding protein [Eubacteriales bacterium]|nr:ABC transporter ATP-binding protein [Eubacteriales bacterium]